MTMVIETTNSSTTDNTLEEQLPWGQLLLEIQKLFSTTHHTNLPTSLELSLNDMTKRASSSNEPSKKLYGFSMEKSKQKLVRIVNQSVPEGILLMHCTAKLYDIKVGGQGPDDKMYNTHTDLRKFIPRGTTIMSINGINGEENLDVVLYANRKFTGNVGDEDESQPENNDIWRSYCLDNPDEADTVVAMEKMNGEAAHFSGRFIDGKFFIITGSKNVHMLIGCEEDIEKYEGGRYTNAKVIARAVWKHLIQMNENHRQILFNLLHHTKCTVCCEILLPNNQHIVNLSNIKEPTLYVLSVTPTVSDDADKSLTALPPHHLLDFVSALGFNTAPYQTINRKDVEKFIQRSRNEVDSEGSVLYYLKNSNGYENTIGMAKTKTIWYVLLRALREKAVFAFTTAKKRTGWSIEDRISSTHKRLNEIQTWLKFSNEQLNEWNNLSKGFLYWLNKEIGTNNETVENIRPHFPMIWERFLTNPGTLINVAKPLDTQICR